MVAGEAGAPEAPLPAGQAGEGHADGAGASGTPLRAPGSGGISVFPFPGEPDARGKLQLAIKAQIDPGAFDSLRGTVSFPFEPGEHHRIAVKVIGVRGNEVMQVMPSEEGQYR